MIKAQPLKEKETWSKVIRLAIKIKIILKHNHLQVEKREFYILWPLSLVLINLCSLCVYFNIHF